MKWIYENRLALMMILAFSLTVFGCVLLILSFYIDPIGIISQSILIAFAEIMTFAGSLLGISVTYKTQLEDLKRNINKQLKEDTNKDENNL